MKRIQFEEQPAHLQRTRLSDVVLEKETIFVIESVERNRGVSTSELCKAHEKMGRAEA